MVVKSNDLQSIASGQDDIFQNGQQVIWSGGGHSAAMKTIVAQEERDGTLSQWRGAHAKIWLFHVTHNRMALALHRRDEAQSLYIVAVGCTRISGPFSWSNADVSVILEPTGRAGESRCRIVDPRIASRNFVTGCLISGVTKACSSSLPERGFCILDLVFISRLQRQGDSRREAPGGDSGFGRGDRSRAQDYSAPLTLTSCVSPFISQINR